MKVSVLIFMYIGLIDDRSILIDRKSSINRSVDVFSDMKKRADRISLRN